MIFDKIENAAHYMGMNPNLDRALRFLAETDLSTLPEGRTEIDGDKVEKTLAPGEVLKVDTGNVVAFERTVKYEVETVKGLKNIFFGGEGLFLTKLTGPGKVILQTQNFGEFAGRINRMLPSK